MKPIRTGALAAVLTCLLSIQVTFGQDVVVPANIDALVARAISLPAGPSDSVPADAVITGRWSWLFSMFNHDSAIGYTNPTITIYSDFDDVTALLPPDWIEGPIAFPFEVSEAALPPFGSLRQDFVFTSITGDLTPGFDSSRSLSPEVIPPGVSTTQILTVTMRLVDGERYAVERNMNVNVGGGACDPDDPLAITVDDLDSGEVITYMACHAHGAGIGLHDVILGKEYTITFALTFLNLGGEPMLNKPSVSVQSNTHASLGFAAGPEVVIPDEILGPIEGRAEFAVDESAPWHLSIAESFIVDYPVVFEPVPDSPLVCADASPSQSLLWPPDHRFVPITIEGVTSPAGHPISTTIVGIFQDEPVDLVGDGSHAPDGVIAGPIAHIRAERAGMGDGRVYHIRFVADDGQGGTCEGVVRVGVPRDQGRNRIPVDGGPLYDSTTIP